VIVRALYNIGEGNVLPVADTDVPSSAFHRTSTIRFVEVYVL
jgi:hypothetical protein